MSSRHRVREGEEISSIAVQHRWGNWQSLWLHDDNSALREHRTNPHVLAPGDVVRVPDVETKTEQGASDQTHVFVCDLPTRIEPLRLKLQHRDGSPVANERYTATPTGGEPPITGQSDGDGLVELDLPVAVQSLFIEIADHEWALEVGHLNPVAEPCRDDGLSGAQSRLANLGYVCPASGSMDDPTRAALRAFQKRRGASETGNLDDATKRDLKERHGC